MILAEFPVLELDRDFILREFCSVDAPNFYNLYKAPEVAKFLPDSLIPNTIEDSAFEIQTIRNSFRIGHAIYWAISERATNALIGGCGFHDWNKYDKKIEIAYELHPKYHRRGITIKSMSKIIEFAFVKMGLERVQATIVEENIASKNLLLKFGFTCEGLLRNYKFFKGSMRDILIFSYTSKDFAKDAARKRFLI